MAKQLGNNPISGKIDGLVYYSTKDGRRLVRRAYPNLSKRVKTAPEFANTRRDNSEFGMCGYVASQLLSIINKRWPSMLKNNAIGDLTKFLYSNLNSPSGSIWGNRNLVYDYLDFNNKLRLKLNGLNNNNIPQSLYSLVDNGHIGLLGSGDYLTVEIDQFVLFGVSESINYLNEGFESFVFRLGILLINYPYFNISNNQYSYRQIQYEDYLKVDCVLSDDADCEIPSGTRGMNNYVASPYEDDSSLITGVLISLIPKKNNVELVEKGCFLYKNTPNEVDWQE